ncbi:hypothetical protein OWM07_10870 [Deferribacter thermophilus]|uniref:hypothetical protein n=1 Tax=Deferribacter thermophilus TaxID=53573 RepID=UPI003C19D12E
MRIILVLLFAGVMSGCTVAAGNLGLDHGNKLYWKVRKEIYKPKEVQMDNETKKTLKDFDPAKFVVKQRSD